MASKKNKKRKKTKFKIITLKLTARQKKSLDKNCKIRRTTPVKLIKRSIKNYLTLVEEEKSAVFYSVRQLELFADEEQTTNENEQFKIAEVISA